MRWCSLIYNIDPFYWLSLLEIQKKGNSYQPGRGLSVLCPSSPFPLCLLDFPSPPDEEEDEEEVYKMAGVMAQCGGLECMLNRLAGIKDFKQGRHLLTVSWRE